ncbi:hypothetical protein GCM10023224_13560 [Streptomonospora halophila]|uniref:Flp family type IVb pilin n=1 Tax=Streptomonospora halophila TaxID=427369 RepID=A0ABP9GDD2_9ACTN
MAKLLVSLHLKTREMIISRLTVPRGDRGASMLEYAALIILVGGVAVALMQLEVFNEIPTTVEESIQEVLNPE